MKTILCYGDSNTWGWNPATQSRYQRYDRWPGALQRALGEKYYIIEEGLPGRTTVWDDPIDDHRNGRNYLIPCLDAHRPLDLVIFMLGTNDLKHRFNLSPFDIAKGMSVLLEIVQTSRAGRAGSTPKMLLLTPPPLRKEAELAELFENGYKKSKRLGLYYKQLADRYGCTYLDAGSIIKTSQVDGVHLDLKEHLELANTLAVLVKKIV